jgi:hypothetical protein
MALDVNAYTEVDFEALLSAAWTQQLQQLRAQMNSRERMTREISSETIGKEAEIR